MKIVYKILLGVPLTIVTMGACKVSYYTNTVVEVKDKKILMKDQSTGEERLLDCSKKSDKYPELQKDLPYFKKDDIIQFCPGKGYTYEGFRAYELNGSKLEYNQDSIQIRKDKEKIDAFKAVKNPEKTR